MEHYKEACEVCIFNEKCSPYEKDENVSCLFFVDNDFSDIDELPESLESFFLDSEINTDGIFRWKEMSWNRNVYGVRFNPTGHVSEITREVGEQHENEEAGF